jgi:hypothetical protein
MAGSVVGGIAMPSPFPGMDPYLEDPALWPDVHQALICQIQATLNEKLRPKYFARAELRVYVSDQDDPGRESMIPDLRIERRKRSHRPTDPAAVATITKPVVYPAEIREEIEDVYLTIRDLSKSLVAVIEVLSPTNKIRGSEGRKAFLKKRRDVLASSAHWVEVDLLRAGERTPAEFPGEGTEYRVVVSHAKQRDRFRCRPVRLQDPFPVVGIPLKAPDPDTPLDLGAVFAAAYEVGAYDLSVNYRKPPRPPLPRSLAGWANQLLRTKGLR